MSSNTLSLAPIFAPTQIPGCGLWLDAADSSTVIRSGSSVSQWNDKSGNGYNATQISSSNQPTYSGSNIRFVSANQQWLSLSQTYGNLFLGNSPFNVFIVAFGSGYGFITGEASAFGQNLFLGYGLIDNYNLYLSGTPPVADSINSINGFEYTGSSGTTGRLYQNGSNYASVVSTLVLTAFTGPQIGRRYTGGSVAYHDHTFCEIITYFVNLTTAQRQQVEGYLAWKWGLQGSLPSNHPYRNTPINSIITLPPLIRNLPNIPIAPSSSPFSFYYNAAAIGGCQMWLDAADTSKFSLSGSNVTTWLDKSGNGNNAVTGNASPTYNSTDNSVNFNGTNQNVIFTNPTALVVNKPFIYFMVEKRQVAVPTMMSGSTAGGNQNLIFGWDGATANQVNIEFYASGKTFISNVPAFTSAALEPIRLWTGIYTGSTRTISLYGGALSSTNGFSTNLASWTNGGMGRIYAGTEFNNYYALKIFEVIFYDSLTNSQQQQVEGYLAWKWGIQASLPSNHAYKNSPPGLPIPVPPRLTMSSRSFSPLSFSGCTLWLDGTDPNGNGNIPSIGSTIATWVDKSSSGINFTGTNVTYSYDSVYKVNAPTFNGSSSIFNQVNTGLYPLNNVSTYSIFSVARRLTTNLYHTIYFATGSGNLLTYRFTNTNVSEWYVGPAADVYINNNSTNGDGINELLTLVSGTATGYLNGNLIGSKITAASSGQLYFILGYQNPLYLNGYIYEVIVYNTAVSTNQRQSIEGYLAWKYSLQGSLPSNHPYKRWPPPS